MTTVNKNSSKMSGSLTTEPDSFSDEAWSLLLIAEQSARRWRHQNLDVEHLIQVLFRNKKFHKYTNPLPINHDDLNDILENFLAELPITNQTDLFIGEDLENLLETADSFRSRWGSNQIEISHILIAIGRDNRLGEDLFFQAGLPIEILEAELRRLPAPKSFKQSRGNTAKPIENRPLKDSKSFISGESTSKNSNREPLIPINKEEIKSKQEPLSFNETPSALDLYCKDLTAEAEAGRLDPVIGREEEIKAIIKVLSRRGKNNPVLIGAPGVGKTAVAELLAQKLIDNKLPKSLQGFKLISLDIGALIAGAKFRGQFEERFRSLLSEISLSEKGVILFIDELHSIVSKERSNTDAGSLLKPLLASGDIRCIGATTPENYRRTIEKDLALDRRFQQVSIKEPSLDLSLEILQGLKENYELHHGVVITDQALMTANRLAHRYISDRCLPDKAIDLIDEASAQVKIESSSKPKIIEEKESQINHLESLISKANKEKSYNSLDNLEEERQSLIFELNNVTQQWQDQLDKSDELQELNIRREELANLIRDTEMSGDFEEADRLKYGQLYQIKERIKEIEFSIQKGNVDSNSLIKDQVNPEDIADVVSRWTGIPVRKVLSGERQKLLNLEQELERNTPSGLLSITSS